MSVITAPAPTREQLIEVFAALHAAGDTLRDLHEEGAGEFFQEIVDRLQGEFFGKAEGDGWMREPLEVELKARASELEADALEQAAPLAERISTLRQMAPRYRELGTIDIMFSDVLRCHFCGTTSAVCRGWRSMSGKNERSQKETVILCPACAKKGQDDA